MEKEQIVSYVAERIKLLRSIRKLTLEKIARQMGVSVKQVQNYESCNCAISVARLWQLSQIMKVNIGFFLEGINGEICETNNDVLRLVYLFNKIKDKEVRDNIAAMIKELAE